MTKGKHKPCKEIPEVNELAMTLVFNVNNTPAILAPTDSLSVNDHIPFWTNDGERNHILFRVCEARCISSDGTKRDNQQSYEPLSFHSDGAPLRRSRQCRRGRVRCCGTQARRESAQYKLAEVYFSRNMWVHPLLEKLPFLHGKTIGFGNDWDDIHNLAKLLHDNDVDRAKWMASRVDEK